MDSWTSKMGHPYIKVIEEAWDTSAGTVTLTFEQRWMLSDGSGNTEEAILAGKDLPTPQAGRKDVTYVLLSEEMKKGVALLQWDPAEELTGEAKTKFTDNKDFPIWFDNGDTIIMKMPDK